MAKKEFHECGVRIPIDVFKTSKKIISKRPRNEHGYKFNFNAYTVEALRAYNEKQTPNKVA